MHESGRGNHKLQEDDATNDDTLEHLEEAEEIVDESEADENKTPSPDGSQPHKKIDDAGPM